MNSFMDKFSDDSKRLKSTLNASGRFSFQKGEMKRIVPEILNTEIYDAVVPVADEDALKLGRAMGRLEGILVGISAGAALWAAIQYGLRPENAGKTVVVILPDTGDRYLSTPLFAEGQ